MMKILCPLCGTQYEGTLPSPADGEDRYLFLSLLNRLHCYNCGYDRDEALVRWVKEKDYYLGERALGINSRTIRSQIDPDILRINRETI